MLSRRWTERTTALTHGSVAPAHARGPNPGHSSAIFGPGCVSTPPTPPRRVTATRGDDLERGGATFVGPRVAGLALPFVGRVVPVGVPTARPGSGAGGSGRARGWRVRGYGAEDGVAVARDGTAAPRAGPPRRFPSSLATLEPDVRRASCEAHEQSRRSDPSLDAHREAHIRVLRGVPFPFVSRGACHSRPPGVRPCGDGRCTLAP